MVSHCSQHIRPMSDHVFNQEGGFVEGHGVHSVAGDDRQAVDGTMLGVERVQMP